MGLVLFKLSSFPLGGCEISVVNGYFIIKQTNKLNKQHVPCKKG